MISKEQINQLIEMTDMVALVSPYTKLIKDGSGYKGLCPFHKENTPSFKVSQEKHVAHCFGCGKGGNPIKFLMEIKNIDFNSAVVELAKLNNMKLEGYEEDPLEKANQKYYKINELAVDFYQKDLLETKSGQKALAYLTKRGLSLEIIKEFKIGLAPNEPNTLYMVLKESKFLEIDMVDVGLVRNSNDKYYDVYQNRIIFPILDEKGRVVGFSGRIYEANSNEPKYMNTSDTPIFKKNLLLYNLQNAKKYIKEKNRVIIHEGFMDVIATYRSGLKEVVCSMGTQLTTNQVRLLKRYTKNVVLAFDSDNAGLKATLRAKGMFELEGFNVKIFEIKDAKDSDEYVLKFGEERYFKFFNENLQDALDYVYKNATANLNINDNIAVEEAKKMIFDALRRGKSELIRNKYINLLAEKLGVDAAILYKDFGANAFYQPNKEKKPPQNSPVILERLYEARIFEYAKSSYERAMYINDFFEKNNCLISFKAENRDIWYVLIDYWNKNRKYDEEEFVGILKEKNLLAQFLNNIELIEKLDVISYDSKDMDDCLEAIIRATKIVENKIIRENISKCNSPELIKELMDKLYNKNDKIKFKK